VEARRENGGRRKRVQMVGWQTMRQTPSIRPSAYHLPILDNEKKKRGLFTVAVKNLMATARSTSRASNASSGNRFYAGTCPDAPLTETSCSMVNMVNLSHAQLRVV